MLLLMMITVSQILTSVEELRKSLKLTRYLNKKNQFKSLLSKKKLNKSFKSLKRKSKRLKNKRKSLRKLNNSSHSQRNRKNLYLSHLSSNSKIIRLIRARRANQKMHSLWIRSCSNKKKILREFKSKPNKRSQQQMVDSASTISSQLLMRYSKIFQSKKSRNLSILSPQSTTTQKIS